MERIETTPQLAHEILAKGNRKIVATKGSGLFFVKWININNNTCMLQSRKNLGFTADNEDYKFFIQVPKGAKTVY